MMFTSLILAKAFATAAGATPVGKFAVVGMESGYACAEKKKREPTSTCEPKVTALPETVVMTITKSGATKRFELASHCRSTKGSIQGTGEKVHVAVNSSKEHCDGQNLSLHHEALFQSVGRINRIEDAGEGKYRAVISDQLAVILKPD